MITLAAIMLMNLYNNTLRFGAKRITEDMVIYAEIDYYNPENMRQADGAASINKILAAKLKITVQPQKKAE